MLFVVYLWPHPTVIVSHFLSSLSLSLSCTCIRLLLFSLAPPRKLTGVWALRWLFLSVSLFVVPHRHYRHYYHHNIFELSLYPIPMCCCIMYCHCCNQFSGVSPPSCCLRCFSLFSSLDRYNQNLLRHANLILVIVIIIVVLLSSLIRVIVCLRQVTIVNHGAVNIQVSSTPEEKKPIRHSFWSMDEINDRSVKEYYGEAPLNS